MTEPPVAEEEVPTLYGPLRDFDTMLAEGPSYVELVQCLHDALAGWYGLIHRTHYPMLRDYEDHAVYESTAAVLESAVRHRPEMIVDAEARTAWEQRWTDRGANPGDSEPM